MDFICNTKKGTEMKTTLNKIREHSPCESGWKKLLTNLNKTKADDEPLSLITILDSNGLDDALWCLRAVKGHEKEIRLYVVWCARQVQHLMTDKRSLKALDVAESFANGAATAAELAATRVAAGDAAEIARAAAWEATWAAAGVAARAAAEAAVAATWAAAWDSAEAAVWVAARAATRVAQEKEFRRVFC